MEDIIAQAQSIDILALAQALVLQYGLALVGAIVIFIVGRWLAGVLSRMSQRLLSRTDVPPALTGFVKNIVYYLILVLAIVAALQNLGVQTTSLIAILGAAGLAIGLALEGALSNFAAGVLIIFFRPFRIGDLVEIADKFGQVDEIQIFNTILVTPDNKTVIIPNSQVTSEPIVNYTKRGLMRVDMVFGIGYEDDLRKAKRVLEEILAADERIVQDPAPTVVVSELADSSVNFTVRPYIEPQHFPAIKFALTETVKLRFDEEGISIPFPQRDVHLFQASAN